MLDELLDGADAVIAAGAAGAAPAGLDSTGSPAQSRPWHVLGLPAVALPAGADRAGMPLGVQLVGRRWGDDALLALGAVGRGGPARAGAAVVMRERRRRPAVTPSRRADRPRRRARAR